MPATRLSADWGWQELLRRGARHLVRSRRVIINFAADGVLRGRCADRGVHTGAARYLVCSVAAWSVITLDAYFVVMLCFKFVYAVLCGILRYLLLVVSS